ncbi:PREDICTED: wound-induced basic protein [Populus euphratica]|uniref:Wound-induced basic protein n=1 Tax=Populus euphratica TaxID=75702 RepID=A0AAJ6U7Y5_POPEU|nr:PREDICTED: wound-induced basic protein [Populus euphratica]
MALVRRYCKGRGRKTRVSVKASNSLTVDNMIYDVNSPLFRSFLSQKGGSSAKRKMEEQKPKEQRPKANENKPVMTE